VDLSRHADLVATSLTKFISGSGDVMGGALICNPRSPHHAALKAQLRTTDFGALWWEDAARIAELAADFTARMPLHNHGGAVLAARLREHPAIERVWYPQWEDAEAYEKLRRPGAGWGGLISLLPRNAAAWAPRIYDALPICKGPSLGTIYSLACPFTLLAHYKELDWAESCGVSANMIRISVGLEEPDALWERIRPALDDVCDGASGPDEA
jgi:cystathionine gamma-synthase